MLLQAVQSLLIPQFHASFVVYFPHFLWFNYVPSVAVASFFESWRNRIYTVYQATMHVFSIPSLTSSIDDGRLICNFPQLFKSIWNLRHVNKGCLTFTRTTSAWCFYINYSSYCWSPLVRCHESMGCLYNEVYALVILLSCQRKSSAQYSMIK